jgi:DNA-directed RNA polymerase subunit RPC12/RpoP
MEVIATKRKCFVCSKEVSEGIEVLGSFICEDCQKKLIDLSPFDEEYEFYRQKMIEIWENYMKEIGYEGRV